MEVSITLKIEQKAGAFARVAGALRRFGVTLTRHKVEADEEGGSRLLLTAEGDDVPEDVLSAGLLDIRGVLEVVELRATTEAAPEPEPEAAPTAAEPAAATAPEEAEDPRVQQLVEMFPRVYTAIIDIEAETPREEREALIHSLGRQVAGQVAGRFPALASASSVHDALETAVLPALKSIAVGSVESGGLRVQNSLFARRYLNMMYAAFDDDPERCHFLTGFVQGMLDNGTELPGVHVSETKCRANGDECCFFKVDAE